MTLYVQWVLRPYQGTEIIIHRSSVVIIEPLFNTR